jgi:2,4-dienoyl-CoA reductase-like NADH-dependent reductase (Old Yellow Enzyme family)
MESHPLTEQGNPELRDGAGRVDPSLLFRPFAIGRTTLRNRFVMAAMTRRRSPGGIPGHEVASYYARRAIGGVGLIITEGTYIDHPAANGYPDVPAFFGSAALDGWARVVEAVHSHDGCIAAQLWHVGSTRRPGIEPRPEVPGYGPARIEEGGATVVAEMTKADISAVVESYARGAFEAERAGFDGVEIHGAHGYLIDEFLWPRSNSRQDDYGGPLANRMRFAVEVVRAVRAAVSADFPIIFRFSQWKMSNYEAQIAETPEEHGTILGALSEAGVDVFHPSTRRFWHPVYEGSPRSLAAWTKAFTAKPVIAVGSAGLSKPHESRLLRTAGGREAGVADVANVVEAMKAGDFDLIASGRALLADPDWVEKIRRGDIGSISAVTPGAYDKLVI